MEELHSSEDKEISNIQGMTAYEQEKIKIERERLEIEKEQGIARERGNVYFWWLFFLGSIGIHKFYVKKVGLGILYIFTGGILWVGLLYDWLGIALGKTRNSEKKEINFGIGYRIFAWAWLVVVFIVVVVRLLFLVGLLDPPLLPFFELLDFVFF